MKIAELYLVCLHCKRIPAWTRTSVVKKPDGTTEKKYEIEGQCPFCGHGEFEVVEVRNKDDGSLYPMRRVSEASNEGHEMASGHGEKPDA